MIGIDFICGLPMTASGFDMIQNQVDLLSGKITAIPTKSTATAEDAARVLVHSCLQSGDGMPDVIVVDHDPKFISAMFRAVVKTMGSSLIVGSAYHKNTNAKVERANGVLGDVLRSFANPRKDDWDLHLPFAVFAINNSVSTLGGHLTPLFIDRGAHPRLPLTSTGTPATETLEHYVARMAALEKEVQELLAAAQAERKAVMDKARVATVFRAGDKVWLRTEELLDAAEIGKLKDRWVGPFEVLGSPSPNAYRLALPKRMKCSPVINVDRLKPFVVRANAPSPPQPVSDAGQEGEMEVEMLVGRRTFRGGVEYLVRWRGLGPEEDSWLRADDLSNCQERVAEFEAAAPRRRAGRRALRPDSALTPTGAIAVTPTAILEQVSDPGVRPRPQAPDGFVIAATGIVQGPELVNRFILFWWPQLGWQLGKVRRVGTTVSVKRGFSHMVTYAPKSSTVSTRGSVLVETLLDAASHGDRWCLLE
jgi:hypothetical protein